MTEDKTKKAADEAVDTQKVDATTDKDVKKDEESETTNVAEEKVAEDEKEEKEEKSEKDSKETDEVLEDAQGETETVEKEEKKPASNNKIIYGMIIVVIAIIAVLFFSTSNKNAEQSGDVVAVVNGENIYSSRVDAQLKQVMSVYQAQGQPVSDDTKAQMRRDTIDAVIGQELIAQEAVRQGIEATDDDVEQTYQTDVLAQYEDEAALDAALAKAGVTKEQLYSDIRQQLTMRNFIDANIDVDAIEISDAKAQEVYDNTAASVGADTLPPFEDVIEEIKASVREEEVTNKLVALVDDLRSKAEVEVK